MTPFTGAILTAGKARAAPLCLHNKQCATWPAVKIARPSVARIGPPGALRRLPDAAASRCTPRLPGRPNTRHERGHYLRSSVLVDRI